MPIFETPEQIAEVIHREYHKFQRPGMLCMDVELVFHKHHIKQVTARWRMRDGTLYYVPELYLSADWDDEDIKWRILRSLAL